MDVEILHPIGAVASDVVVDDLSDADLSRLTHLLAEHGVVVFHDQHLDDGAFLGFLRRLGELTFTTGETPVPDFPDLNVISNVGRTTPPKSSFHTDSSYLRRPPSYTALRTVSVPAHGGATQFTNQYRSFDTLDPGLRDRLAGSIVTHVATGVELGPDDEASSQHPLFCSHPISGRTSLFMSTPARCAAVDRLGDDAPAVVAELYRHSTQPGNVLEHVWTAGDVVIWDNLVVLHRADHHGVVGDRVMHRGMVVGYPFPTTPQ